MITSDFYNKSFENIMNIFKPNERKIIYQLDNMTPIEVAAQNGLTPERIRQVKAYVIRRIRSDVIFMQIHKGFMHRITNDFNIDKRYLVLSNIKLGHTMIFKYLNREYLFTKELMIEKKWYEYKKNILANDFKEKYYVDNTLYNRETLDFERKKYHIHNKYLLRGNNGIFMMSILEGNVSNITDEFVEKFKIDSATSGRSVRSFLELKSRISKISSTEFVPRKHVMINDLNYANEILKKSESSSFSKTMLKNHFSIFPYPFDLFYYSFKEKYEDDYIFSRGRSMNIKKVEIKIHDGRYKIWKRSEWYSHYGWTDSVFQFSKFFYKAENNVIEMSSELCLEIEDKLSAFDFSVDKFFYKDELIKFINNNDLNDIDKKIEKFPLSIFSSLYKGKIKIKATINRIIVVD